LGRSVDTVGMTNSNHRPTYKRHRYPQEIIAHAIWLYFNFNLSYRDVETILAERGITVSYEAIRYWCLKFGHAYARRIRRHRPQTGDQGHVDEVFIKINGKTQYLYRAIDQHGHILEIMVHQHRNKQAAIRFFRKLLVGCQYVPRVLVTDKLRSYPAAKRCALPSVEHRQHKRLNNVIENSHRRVRKRERMVQRFKAGGSAQRFLSVFEVIYEHFHIKWHQMTASTFRQQRRVQFASWQHITALTV
jgi:putative transposase